MHKNRLRGAKGGRASKRSRSPIWSKPGSVEPAVAQGRWGDLSQEVCAVRRLRSERFLVGWLGYFRFCETPSVPRDLEKWTRRRLRGLIWQHWKRGPRRYRELRRRGLTAEQAAKAAGTPAGPWRMSRTPWLTQAFPRAWFLQHGLPAFPV